MSQFNFSRLGTSGTLKHSHANIGSGGDSLSVVNDIDVRDIQIRRNLSFFGLSVSIAANQNNWSPWVDGVAPYITLTCTGAARTITGIDSSWAGLFNASTFFLSITATNNCVLANQSASSLAENRIICPSGTNLTIPSGGGVWLYYDLSALRWRVVSLSASALTDHTHAVTGSGATGGGPVLSPEDLTVSQDLLLTGSTTFTMVGNMNDVATANKSVLLFNTGANDYSVTGFDNGVDGRIIFAQMIGTYGWQLDFFSENVSSLAANRIAEVDGNVFLRRGNGTFFRYDGTISRWRPMSAMWNYGEVGDIGVMTLSSAAAAGTSTEVARADHVHQISGIYTVLEPSISANQNDWTPTGLAPGVIIRPNLNGASRTITGILAQANGSVIYLKAGGANTIILSHESASSLVANRISCPGAVNYTITDRAGVALWYTTTGAHWELLDK